MFWIGLILRRRSWCKSMWTVPFPRTTTCLRLLRKPRRAALLHLREGNAHDLPSLGLHELNSLNDVGQGHVAPTGELRLLLLRQGRLTDGLLDLIHNELRLVLVRAVSEDLYLGDLLDDELQ